MLCIQTISILSFINARAENPISRKYELGKGIIIFKASSYDIGYLFANWNQNLDNESHVQTLFFLKSQAQAIIIASKKREQKIWKSMPNYELKITKVVRALLVSATHL